MKPRRRLLVCVLVLAGCSTDPKLPSRAAGLVPGRTTITEAIAMLGPPSSRSTLANGITSIVWSETSSQIFGVKAAALAVLFDPSGRMIRVAHESNTSF